MYKYQIFFSPKVFHNIKTAYFELQNQSFSHVHTQKNILSDKKKLSEKFDYIFLDYMVQSHSIKQKSKKLIIIRQIGKIN